MSKLIITRGLPASGKSTWAKAQTARRISRDDLRRMLGDYNDFSSVREEIVTRMEEEGVVACLSRGQDVIVDACHLNPKYVDKWKNTAAWLQADFEIKDFDVPLEECLLRNADRDERVDPEVIKRFHKEWLQ